ncbi:hypothetical protein [Blastococcus sp. Marseille-P5729]|uniref:hypothetical protein n=1 Tax=Blastococcus sp. Marseille-P5729 TaxID=2086582 RepID=UPI000D0EC71E|nr:hypothetical protein [Blastococcus sp. Marseille-P5729]
MSGGPLEPPLIARDARWLRMAFVALALLCVLAATFGWVSFAQGRRDTATAVGLTAVTVVALGLLAWLLLNAVTRTSVEGDPATLVVRRIRQMTFPLDEPTTARVIVAVRPARGFELVDRSLRLTRGERSLAIPDLRSGGFERLIRQLQPALERHPGLAADELTQAVIRDPEITGRLSELVALASRGS